MFERTHELVLALVAEGLVDGLRIDHPDGLADPAGYLTRLRERGRRARLGREDPRVATSGCATGRSAGTVGYEFLNDVCALFVDPAGEAALTALWERVSGDRRAFERARARGQARAGEHRRSRPSSSDWRASSPATAPAGRNATRSCGRSRHCRYTAPTWSRRRGWSPTPTARAIDEAGMAAELAGMLLLDREAPPEFVTRFQQTTPAIMAKGVEDTAFYRYGRLLALNEVGGDPGRFSIEVERLPRRPAWSARDGSPKAC